MRNRRLTLALLATAAALVFFLPMLALLSGCGASAVQRHSYVAEAVDDVTQVARGLVLEARQDALRAAGRTASEAGLPTAEAIAAAADAFDAGPMVVTYNVLVEAKNAYVRALLARIREHRRPGMEELRPLVLGLLRAYAAHREALGIRADRLPLIPELEVAP
jgi:hypothetical protein